MAASYIANVLESAVCATVQKALPPVLAGFSQCVVKTLAAASVAMQQQQRSGSSSGQQQQLLMVAAEELLHSLQVACQKAISTAAVSELMQNGSSIQALIAGGELQQQLQPGAAVAALAAAADAAGAMGHQELAAAAMAAAQASVVKPEYAAAATAAAEAALNFAASSQPQQDTDIEAAEVLIDAAATVDCSQPLCAHQEPLAQPDCQQCAALPGALSAAAAHCQPVSALPGALSAAVAAPGAVLGASPAHRHTTSEDCEGTGTGTNTEHAAETSPESDRGVQAPVDATAAAAM
jgi:hypothetical protein